MFPNRKSKNRFLHATSILALAAALQACSPYVYESEVKGFATGVEALNKGYLEGLAQVQLDHEAALDSKWIAGETSLRPSAGCKAHIAPLDELASSRDGQLPVGSANATQVRAAGSVGQPLGCHILEDPKRAGEKPGKVAYTLEVQQKQILAALPTFKAFSSYADGLAQITNAQDTQAYDAAVSKLSTSVKSVATAADLAVPGISTGLATGTTIFGYILGAQLNQARLEKLREAVTAVDVILEDPIAGPEKHGLRSLMTEALVAIKDQRSTSMNNHLDALASQLKAAKGSDYRRVLGEMRKLQRALEALRKSDSSGAVKAMAKAHNELRTALNDPSRQAPAVAEAIGKFVEQAKAIEELLNT